MIVKMAMAAITLLALAESLCAQEVFIQSISGQLFADGRPVEQTFEVRLEGQDLSLAATAYTLGDSRFTFNNVPMRLDQQYSLVIRTPGYKELRHDLIMADFRLANSFENKYHFAGIIILNLESLPREPDVKSGSKVVDAKQLGAETFDAAQREYDLALVAAQGEDREQALAHLEKAVELAPDFYDAMNKLGLEYLRAGQYRKAEMMLNRARTLNPADPAPVTNLGILHLQEGETLAEAADAAPDAAKASYDKAVSVFEEVTTMGSSSPRVHLYLGTALYKLGRYERAESVLIRALSLDGTMHEARLTLVSIYMRQKRYHEALEQISAHLEANPDSPQREKLEDLKDQIEGALATSTSNP